MSNPTPNIPEGLATKLGKWGIPVALLLGILADALDVEHDGSEKGFWAAFGLAALTMLGRFAQGYAQQRDAPSPSQLENAGVVDDFTVPPEDDLPDEPPTEDKLRNGFPEDPPHDPSPDELMPEGGIGGKPGGAL